MQHEKLTEIIEIIEGIPEQDWEINNLTYENGQKYIGIKTEYNGIKITVKPVAIVPYVFISFDKEEIYPIKNMHTSQIIYKRRIIQQEAEREKKKERYELERTKEVQSIIEQANKDAKAEDSLYRRILNKLKK